MNYSFDFSAPLAYWPDLLAGAWTTLTLSLASTFFGFLLGVFCALANTGRVYDDVVRPVGRIWFANDACDARARRWIEGAIAAAVKNAYAIHAGMRDELPVGAER